MSEEVQGPFKRNSTLDDALVAACQHEGMGWYGCFRVRMALRRMSAKQRQQLEQECTRLATESGLPMGASDIVGGCYVGEWGDGTFFQMLIDALPKILDFISKLIPLFFMFA